MPDAIDMLRQQLGQQPEQPDAISQLRDQTTDVGTLPELAEEGPRIGKLTKPGMDFMPALQASLSMMMNDDPEKLAGSLEGIRGIRIGRSKDNKPFAEIGGQKYQLNKEGMSLQDIANFSTQLVAQLGAGKVLKALPFLRGAGTMVTAAREGLAGLFGGAGKESAGEAVAGQVQDPLAIGTEGIVNAAGGVVGSVLGVPLGRLFKSGARFLDPSGNLTQTARRALSQAKIDPDTLDRQTLQQADTILRRQVGGRPTGEEMVQGVAHSDIQDTGIPLSKAEQTGSLPAEAGEVKLAEGIRGPEAQDVMAGFARQQEGASGAAVENVAGGESPGLPRVNEAEAGSRVRGELQTAHADAEQSVDDLYQQAHQRAQASGITVPSDWRTAGSQFQLRNLGMADVNEGTAPRTAAVVDFLRDQFTGATARARAAARAAGAPPNVVRTVQGEFNPMELEGLRKQIGRAARRTTEPTDKAALVALRSKFDDFLTNEVGSHDPEVLRSYEAARDFHAETRKAFTPQGPSDVGGKLIQKTVEDTNVDQNVIDKMFGSGSKINPDGVLHYQRLVGTLGADNPGVQTLRQSMVRRIALGDANAQARSGFSPKTIYESINQALEGKGGDYVQQALGPETLRDLRVLQRQMGRLVRSPKLGNPPRSGYITEAAARAAQRLNIADLVGTAVGVGSGVASGPLVGAALGIGARVATKKLGDAGSAALGAKAARKAIAQVPILRGAQSALAHTRALTGPVGRTAEGLLPSAGGPIAGSLFDAYGPQLDLDKL